MPRVDIGGKRYTVARGTPLSEFLINEGFAVEHLCGGRGVCQKCTVLVNGEPELSCRHIINNDIAVELEQSGNICSETGISETGTATNGDICFALDLGTTTLALALVDTSTAKAVRVVTADNPQRRFGADVMSRIDYCTKNSVASLQSVLIEQINQMLSLFDVTEAETMYVSGNVTMLHLFFGVDCSSIGVAPYTPAFLESRKESGDRLGLTGIGTVISLPSVASFVGADIIAGLGFIGRPEKGKYRLLIDLGTNAEIALYSDNKALCTAAAAGPCFEGANISCGMSATPGAVYAYKNGRVSTIGDAAPKGICGTGLIDIIAHLLSTQQLDETGYMEAESFEVAEGVVFTQDDVRQYQLAKSAVYSAVMCLIKRMGIEFSDIERMYISGGFSAKLDIENAIFTGLLPRELKHKCVAINNSSLQGTVKFAAEHNDLSLFVKNTEYVDLSDDLNFANLFVENMLFA